MKTRKGTPSFFTLNFLGNNHLICLSFKMNHLNPTDATCGLAKIGILAFTFDVKIKVFSLNSRDYEVGYPEKSLREWLEISLLTENDHHCHFFIF